MSVLASKRNLSKLEYAYYFMKLYDYTIERLQKIPKRKAKRLGRTILNEMNEISYYIQQLANKYFAEDESLCDKPEHVKMIVGKIEDLQMPLYALWIEENYDEKHMVIWASMLNQQVRLLLRHAGLLWKEEFPIHIINKSVFDEFEVLNNIRELHRFIYTKTTNMNTSFRETKGTLLMDLADKALFNLCEANRKIPEDHEEFVKREKRLAVAQDCINQMQIPILSLITLSRCSEETTQEWLVLVNTELKLINGLRKSDKERFKELA